MIRFNLAFATLIAVTAFAGHALATPTPLTFGDSVNFILLGVGLLGAGLIRRRIRK